MMIWHELSGTSGFRQFWSLCQLTAAKEYLTLLYRTKFKYKAVDMHLASNQKCIVEYYHKLLIKKWNKK